MSVFIGKIVLYRYRPGQIRAGQIDDPGVVTRVNGDGSLDLRVFPHGLSDTILLARVPPMSDSVTGHCWHDCEGEQSAVPSKPRGRRAASESTVAAEQAEFPQQNLNVGGAE